MSVKLTKELAQAIVETVKSDPVCRERINSLLTGVVGGGNLRNTKLGLNAGWDKFTNTWNPLDIVLTAPDFTQHDLYICTGIAEVTVAALNRAIQKKSSPVLSAQMAKAESLPCEAFSHAATGIHFLKPSTIEMGQQSARQPCDCVFDFWNNLDIQNPCVFLSEEDYHAYFMRWVDYNQFMGKVMNRPPRPPENPRLHPKYLPRI